MESDNREISQSSSNRNIRLVLYDPNQWALVRLSDLLPSISSNFNKPRSTVVPLSLNTTGGLSFLNRPRLVQDGLNTWPSVVVPNYPLPVHMVESYQHEHFPTIPTDHNSLTSTPKKIYNFGELSFKSLIEAYKNKSQVTDSLLSIQSQFDSSNQLQQPSLSVSSSSLPSSCSSSSSVYSPHTSYWSPNRIEGYNLISSTFFNRMEVLVRSLLSNIDNFSIAYLVEIINLDLLPVFESVIGKPISHSNLTLIRKAVTAVFFTDPELIEGLLTNREFGDKVDSMIMGILDQI